MKRFTIFRLLYGLLLPLVAGAQSPVPAPISYTLAGQVYHQDFDGLPLSGTIPFPGGKGPFALASSPVNAAGMEGWFILQTGGSSTNAQLLTGTGSGTASGAYSFGASKNTNRSLGSLASGSGVYAFGLLLSNQTGVTLDSCTLSFTVEQWRKGGSGHRNTYTFSYATGNLDPPFSSALITVPALNLQSVVYTTGASALNGKLPANQYLIRHTIRDIHWNLGEQLLLRWDDHDEPGNDDALAIDDFSFSAFGTAPVFVEDCTVSPVRENTIEANQWICAGSKPSALIGSIISSEKSPIAYAWEYTTVSASNGFLPAPGINNLPHYAPPVIETNTWFRRKLTMSACSSYSAPVSVTAMKDGLWLGNINRDWNNANNWCGANIPSSSTDVFIPASSPYSPQITSSASCNHLTLSDQSALQISGVLQCGGSINAPVESIDATGGSIELNGLQPQTLSSTALLQHTIHHLTINNNKVYLKDSLNVSGMLSCRKGMLETNGWLVLKEGSRIGPVAAESGINGNVHVEYLLPDSGIHLLAHPFSTALDTKLLTQLSNTESLSFFDENAGYLSFDKAAAWTSFDSSANMPEPGWEKHQGLRMQIKGPPTIIVLSGRINQGSQEIFLPPDQYTGYRLVVNPYPCPVDMLHSSPSNNIAPYFWIWDSQQGLHGGYTSIPFKSHFMMPAFASFFIKTYAFTENHLLFTEQAKLTGEPPNGFMETTDDPYHLELRLESDGRFWDRILLFHIDSARDAIDPLDAEKIMNPDISFYSFSADKNALSADARPFHKKTLIPLGIRSNVSGLFRIRTARKYLPEKLVLCLHDKLLGRWMQLEKDSSYYFRLGHDTLNGLTDRFEITAFKKELATISIPSRIRLLAGPVPANDRLFVDFKAMQPGNCSLHLFSLQGQQVRSFMLGFRQEGRFTISLAGIPKGLYILELKCGSDTVVKKVMIGDLL